jgi:uncharacterized membrane protein YccC
MDLTPCYPDCMARLSVESLFSSARKSGWLVHSARTRVGATASLAVARLLGMPVAYWAPITTLIVMQSSLGAAWTASKPRFIGTALGAALGGLLASYFEPGIGVFGAAICVLLRLDQSAYRFAGITLTILMLVVRGQAPWLIAVRRFVEVSLGIDVALALTALWPGHELASGKNPR